MAHQAKDIKTFQKEQVAIPLMNGFENFDNKETRHFSLVFNRAGSQISLRNVRKMAKS